jgi:hypothetical protein
MPFDEKFKEGAQANDAVDRLRELKTRLEIERANKERRATWLCDSRSWF